MTKQKHDLQQYSRLLHYVKPYWRMFVFSILCMVLLAATEPALAALIKPLLDGALIENNPDKMFWVPLLLVGLFLIRGIASFVSASSMAWVSNKVITDIRGEMFSKLMSFPSQYYDRRPSGTLISLFTYDVLQIKQASTNAVTTAVRDSLAVIGLLALMLYFNWKLTLIAFVAAPFIAIVILIIRKRLRKMSLKVQDTMSQIHHVLNECITNHKLIKLFSGKQQESERFHDVINNYRHYEMKFVFASAASSPLVQFISMIAFATIVYIASRQAVTGEISVGTFVSFFGAMFMLLGPLKRLVRINEHIQRGLAACDSIFNLLDEPVETDSGSVSVSKLKGEIEFKDVDFSYNNNDSKALNNLSLQIEPGQTIALVGQSGSGKTTIANLLPAFYKLNHGKILFDGIDIQEITLESLRKNIALVSQDIELFNDTVRNNIAFGELRDIDDNSIIEAAKAAHAHDFIMELSEGFNTVIGEQGVGLSGGQRQRLAIARAILKDAPILVLDEATSSLDAKSERQIQIALEAVRKGRTCLIIAHRLSTVKNADVILFIENGHITEAGTHDELLQSGSDYAKLHQLQLVNNN